MKIQSSKQRSRKGNPANPANPANPIAIIDKLADLAADLDYRVDPDDFILYELARFIDEDRVSFEDPEFQALIDEGIREHVETKLDVRAELTGIFRKAVGSLTPEARVFANRLIRALEDLDGELRGAAVVVRTYTAWLFRRLEAADDTCGSADDLAQQQIGEWREGRLSADQLISGLASIGRAAVPAAADHLFDMEERTSASVAIESLARIGSPPAARALAYAISEPMLDEDLEQLAFERLKSLWPLSRHYMLVTLRRHEHEDLPVRWFQMFAECQEPEAVERTLEEVVRHAAEPAYRDDLSTLLEFLNQSHDPALSTKLVEALNDSATSPAAVTLLEEFLKSWHEPESSSGSGQDNPWRNRARLAEIHRRYRAAAQLADEGRSAEAAAELDRILQDEPGYPFAVMLRAIIG